EREVRFAVRQTHARRLFVPGVFRGFDHGELARRLAREEAGLEAVIVDDSLPDGDPPALPPAPPETSQAPAPARFRLYTPGTTADPKGALHTDHTLMHQGRIICDVLELEPSDRIALAFPFTHIGGLGWLIAGLMSGAAHIVIPIFDAKKSIDALARHGVTL